MFNNKKKVIALMDEAFGGRAPADIVSFYEDFRSSGMSLPSFLSKWELISKTLNYPDPRKMRPDDELGFVMGLNNTGLVHEEFEDAYEIVQAIDIEAFHKAIDARVELKTVRDLLGVL